MTSHTQSKCAVYAITHIDSGKKYVGSSINYINRLKCHKSYLKRGIHTNRYLQSAWNKYGEDSFSMRPLIICQKDNLLFYEQSIIDGYGTHNKQNGFNLRKIASSNLGCRFSKKKPISEESRARMSAAKKGQPSPNKGKPMLPHVKEALLRGRKEKFEALRGYKWPNNPKPRTIRKGSGIGSHNKGVPMSEESKKKLSDSQILRLRDPEIRERMRLSKLGKKTGPYKSGNATKTHCPKGHPYSGSNLYIHPKSKRRDCRECRGLRAGPGGNLSQ